MATPHSRRSNKAADSSQGHDITRTLISNQIIYDNLNTFFPDSIFLDRQLTILGCSRSIQQALGYTIEEIYGKSVSCLDLSGTLEGTLKSRLMAGFFPNEVMPLDKKWGGVIHYNVSGFCLGLLSDISGLIVLRLVNKTEVQLLDQELTKAKAEFDNFIYRAAHDLRGPLATIKGLINLFKIRQDDSEVDRLVHLIEAHAEKLDERLHQLVYIAEINNETNQPSYQLSFSDLETHLRKIIEINAFVDFLELHVSAPNESISGYNEMLIQDSLTYAVLHFLSLPKGNTNNIIAINAQPYAYKLSVVIKAEGFLIDVDAQKILESNDASIYTDLLKYSRLSHFFAMQKLVLKLKAALRIDFLGPDCQQISIDIPKL